MVGIEECLTSAQTLDALSVIQPDHPVSYGIAKTLVGAAVTGLPFVIGSIWAGKSGLAGAGLLALFPYFKDDLMKGWQIAPNTALSRVVKALDFLVNNPVKQTHHFFLDGSTSLLNPISREPFPPEPGAPLYCHRNGGFTDCPTSSDVRYGTRVIPVETGADLLQLVESLNGCEKPPYALMNGFVVGSSSPMPGATATHLVSGTLKGEGLTLAVHCKRYYLNASIQTLAYPDSRLCLMGAVSEWKGAGNSEVHEGEGVVHLDLEILSKALTVAAYRSPG